MDIKVSFAAAELKQSGLLSCSGDDARAYLHAQLTNDIAGLAAHEARIAGWCSAKGRLLATFLVVAHGGEFLLQVPRDMAPAVAKRLSMFILRAKAKLVDASDAWAQFGFWGGGAAERLAALGLALPQGPMRATHADRGIVVQVAAQRYWVLVPAAQRAPLAALASETGEGAWALEEIRAGRPLVVQATQDQFVPQMVNLERLGAVDFKKGCYPGQEIVARTQYRGVLKRRMVRARVAAQAAAGDDLFADALPGQASGAVVNAAALPDGGSELLAVAQIGVLEGAQPMRLRSADGPVLEILPLPYA
ncbi:MAG: folate-binding protein [Betaproteobacteria bacterium]|nr:folate-binding protein [Betaproteobacteria bacterium]MDH4325869.1 folate-binding protein [Betaproteobacteria bacterium]